MIVENRAVEFFSLNSQRHRIARFGIATSDAGNQRWHAVFTGVNNIIIRHCLDGHSILCQQIALDMMLRRNSRGIPGIIG